VVRSFCGDGGAFGEFFECHAVADSRRFRSCTDMVARTMFLMPEPNVEVVATRSSERSSFELCISDRLMVHVCVGDYDCILSFPFQISLQVIAVVNVRNYSPSHPSMH
jgi:hypothetical protein